MYINILDVVHRAILLNTFFIDIIRLPFGVYGVSDCVFDGIYRGFLGFLFYHLEFL
jgi:hypothetical protein